MAQPKKARTKRAKKQVESEGIAYIKATFNNTLITITNLNGDVVTWGSAGKAGFKGSKKSTPFAATVSAEQVGREAYNLGVRRVHVRVQGPGSGAGGHFLPTFFLPATVRFGPFRVRALVLVRWPRTGRPRRWRMPSYEPISTLRRMSAATSRRRSPSTL